MSVLNHKYRYIFLHEPHCGGRSIEQALMQHEDSENFNGDHHIPVPKILHSWLSEEVFEEYFTFRFIRNPYDYLVTCWITYNKQRKPFNEWVLSDGLSLQKNDTLFWRYTDAKTTYKLDGELDSNLHVISKRCGCPDIILPHRGKITNKPDWRDLLTIDEVDKVRELYPDIERYDYV